FSFGRAPRPEVAASSDGAGTDGPDSAGDAVAGAGGCRRHHHGRARGPRHRAGTRDHPWADERAARVAVPPGWIAPSSIGAKWCRRDLPTQGGPRPTGEASVAPWSPGDVPVFTKEISMRLTEGAEQKLREQVALFRYGVIADLIHLEPGTRGIYAKLREKAERDYDIPGSSRRRVAAETIRSWLSDYRGGGFDALMPKKRRDDGQARALPAEVCDLLLMIKDDRRELSVKEVIECARASGEVPPEVVLAPSTVHRLLSRHGLMKQPRAAAKDRRRFSFEMAGELWMSDVMHGPAVVSKGRRKKKSYLLALIDDATRLVPHAAFAFHENASA